MTSSAGCGCGCSQDDKPLNITARPGLAADTQATRVEIDGMTCGHCVASVSEELQEIPGVTDVQVELVANGTSTATITSSTALDEQAIRSAIDEAGYSVKAVLS